MKYTVLCKFELLSLSRDEAIAELLELFPVGDRSKKLLAGALDLRENIGATLVHNDIALPHCRSILVDTLTIAVGKSKNGIGWPEQKVSTVVLFVSSVKPNSHEEHNLFLRHIANKIKKSGDMIAQAGNQVELLDLLGFQIEEQKD